jgi:hypothetical protein
MWSRTRCRYVDLVTIERGPRGSLVLRDLYVDLMVREGDCRDRAEGDG